MLAVVVLYCCRPEDSTTINTLRQLLPPFADRLHILVYDNSPQPWKGKLDDGWSYQHDGSNGGIAAAYNAAFHMAENSAEWLLLFDQDSSLSGDFLEELFLAIDQCEHNLKVAAVVPRIYAGNMLLSPSRIKLGRCVRDWGTGLIPYEITALNSGSLIRVSVLAELGGFSPEFWLDFLDYWLYHQIHRLGYRVFVSHALMKHNLSVLDYNQSISYERYRNILAAEMRFTNNYRPWFERVLYLIRLVFRSAKQLLRVNERHVVWPTMTAAIRQLRLLVTGSPL